MTADDDHSEIRAVWHRLRSRLRDLRQYENLDFGDDTFHVEFAEKANRAANLELHLEAAVQLSDLHLYGPALALTRSCLEHAILDWLVFRGHTYVQRIEGVSDEDWAVWEEDRKAGASWTANIVSWNRTRKGDVTIRRAGLYTETDESGDREQLSIYYFLLDQYDGLIGRPADQRDDGFLTRDQLRARAAENQEHWLVYLRWSALLENLVLNDLVAEDDRARLGVHYAFLSTFAHPVSSNQQALYGTRLDGRSPHYDHYTSELVLLYVITLGALELENYREGVKSRFGVDLTDASGLDDDLRDAHEVSSYFWFIGSNPHAWDFHRVVNKAAVQLIREGSSDAPTVPEPSEIPFPRDPLLRLIGQHRSTRGRVRGTEYVSPWPRIDATGLR